jgi:hypothetical protein
MRPTPHPIAYCLGALLLLTCQGGDDELRLVGTVERTLIELVAPIAEAIVELGVERGLRAAERGQGDRGCGAQAAE